MLDMAEWKEYCRLWVAKMTEMFGGEEPPNWDANIEPGFDVYRIEGKEGITHNDVMTAMVWEDEFYASM